MNNIDIYNKDNSVWMMGVGMICDTIYGSEIIKDSDAPSQVVEVLGRWNGWRINGSIPLKSDVRPWELTEYLPRILIYEAMGDRPEDFLVRLQGTNTSEAAKENLTNKPLSQSRFRLGIQHVIRDLANDFSKGVPVIKKVCISSTVSTQTYIRLSMPLADGDGNRRFLMVYSHDLRHPSGKYTTSFNYD